MIFIASGLILLRKMPKIMKTIFTPHTPIVYILLPSTHG